TRAVAALEHATLSRRNALDADSLRKLAVARRADGDASDLEVELATLNAGQQANIAADDSSAAVSSLLDLQSLIGEATDRVAIQPSDSLAMPPDALTPARVDSTLPVGAAAMSLHAADLGAALERRSIWGMPSVLVGLETRDPTGAERGILPTLGFSLPFPLLDKNRGAIAVADAERDRAQAELALARVETEADIARAARLRQLALAKIARDTTLIADANRLSSMALDAYREGASTIPTVLEAQRNAREQRGQLIDDLAAAWIATAELRVFQLTPSSLPPK
ncbi:MAG TPA: TolC family protein, partial [Gemmatimonadaceae bacterium]|nr:TolC family protein [Gemmatimonadaceae bacterium]